MNGGRALLLERPLALVRRIEARTRAPGTGCSSHPSGRPSNVAVFRPWLALSSDTSDSDPRSAIARGPDVPVARCRCAVCAGALGASVDSARGAGAPEQETRHSPDGVAEGSATEGPVDALSRWEQLLDGELTGEAPIGGRLRLPASEHECFIGKLSREEMSLEAPDAAAVTGQQVMVLTQDLPRLIGVVTSVASGRLGVRFARPLSAEMLARVALLKRRVRTPRTARVKVELPGSVCFAGGQHEIVVRNISAGGLMMTTQLPVRRGQRKQIRDGQALMIHLPELLPISGHVRWTCGGICGIMFSKLLSNEVAEYIVRLTGLSAGWIDDVRLAHEEFDKRASLLRDG
jgi:hypothetical protein